MVNARCQLHKNKPFWGQGEYKSDDGIQQPWLDGNVSFYDYYTTESGFGSFYPSAIIRMTDCCLSAVARGSLSVGWHWMAVWLTQRSRSHDWWLWLWLKMIGIVTVTVKWSCDHRIMPKQASSQTTKTFIRFDAMQFLVGFVTEFDGRINPSTERKRSDSTYNKTVLQRNELRVYCHKMQNDIVHSTVFLANLAKDRSQCI